VISTRRSIDSSRHVAEVDLRSPVPLAALVLVALLAVQTLAGGAPPVGGTGHGVPVQQPAAAPEAALHRPFDQLLDLYVRDGYVYYGALRSDRAKLDRYLASLAGAEGVDAWPRERQIALWLNAYNALVLQAVVTGYPIRGHAAAYPADSVRQIPGAFERTVHRVAGRSLTLDAIEKTVLASFKDPRVFFALGRGAVGSGRLRSEAFMPGRLEGQLKDVAAEVVTRPALFRIDQMARQVTVSAIFGWREADFIAAYGANADPRFANRSPIERAIVAFALPNLLPAETQFVNQNNFQVSYGTFDWRLNDLAVRR
jgi:hypothetical protein